MTDVPSVSAAPSSHNYFSQRLKLHYVEWGKKDAPVLLMIHGIRDHCRNWDWVAQDLCQEYRIIAPDLRGHGDSDWMVGGTYYFTDFVADINQLVNQVTKEGEKISVLCHSFGGSVGLYYSGIFPEKVEKLIAIEGLGPPPQMLEAMQKTTVDARMKDWMESLHKSSSRTPKKYQSLEEAVARMHEENKFLSEEQARHLSVHGLNQNEDGTWSWKFDNYLRVSAPVRLSSSDQKTLWSRVSCPVLLLNGDKSWALPPQKDERAQYFSDVEFYTVERAGHWLHHDKLDEFLKVLRKFLTK
jgi:pimeloyl-ACP methyl ester carboxylesterase